MVLNFVPIFLASIKTLGIQRFVCIQKIKNSGISVPTRLKNNLLPKIPLRLELCETNNLYECLPSIKYSFALAVLRFENIRNL
jgi:hypothetical protein